MQAANINPVITSVGNPWIICNSQSHPGRIYYFNTFTGEAAWNLSEAEIEKAKKRTKALESQPTGSEIENCPEPKEPPIDNSRNLSSMSTTQTLVKTKEILSLFRKEIENNPSNSRLGQHSPHNNSISIHGLDLPSCAPNMQKICSLPDSIAPPCTKMKVPQPTASTTQYVTVQKTTGIPLTERFKNNDNPRTIINSQTDLRQILWAKKLNNIKPETFEEEVSEDYVHPSIIEKGDSDIFHNNILGDNQYNHRRWLDDSIRTQRSNINQLSPKNGIDLKMHTDNNWYIVPDTSVLLYHHKLLNDFLQSDNNCHLMLTEQVMTEVHHATKTFSLKLLADDACSFISHQSNAGFAHIDNGNVTLYNDAILNCCIKLLLQNFRVIIISDDVNYHKYKKDLHIRVWTVEDFKLILRNSTYTSSSRSASPETLTYTRRGIKITIPNCRDSPTENTFENVQKQNSFTQTEKTDNNSIDVAVQTDINHSQFKEFMNIEQQIKVIGQLHNNDDHTPNESAQDSIINQPTLTSSAKESRLKRFTSQDPMSSIDPNRKKKIRLRRGVKSNASITSNNDSTSSTYCSQADFNSDNMVFVKSYTESNKLNRNEDDRNNKTNSSNFIPIDLKDNSVTQEVCHDPLHTNVRSNDVHSIREQKYDQNNLDTNCNNKQNENAAQSFAMFEVTNQAMEECLKMKCDEWVSRFVQIMEDVLTQILQQDSTFFNPTMPPPWTIREATECIKQKYSNESDVLDASINMLNILSQTSDVTGKINIDISPKKYMEMYSYGIYLIDTLQNIISSEDLLIAQKSLTKLLNDIANPHLDTSVNDSFHDMSHEPTTNIGNDLCVEGQTIEPVKNNDEVSEEKKTIHIEESSPRQNNLRSQKEKKLEASEESSAGPVKFIRNIDIKSGFLATLNLTKTLSNSRKNDNIVNEKSVDNFKYLHNLQNLTTPGQNLLDTTKADEKSAQEPKIIMRFSKDPHYEWRIKNKFDDNNSEDFTKEEDNCDSSVVNFKDIMEIILSNVQESCHLILNFCSKSYEELISTDLSSVTKSDIKQKAEQTSLYIDGLLDALKSILYRDAAGSKNNVNILLKNNWFECVCPDETEIEDYQLCISKCLNQVHALKESVDVVVSAARE